MTSIHQMVQTALKKGYLTIEAENTLCQLFECSCNLRDITALTLLQEALLSGHVKRLSQKDKSAYSS